MEKALEEFISSINNTGGVVLDPSGNFYVPVADLEWVDLGAAYMSACAALNVVPHVEDTAVHFEIGE